jgi:hypothetical protein
VSTHEQEDDSALLGFFERMSTEAGTTTLSSEEVKELLRLAKVVADLSERRFAPVSCYVAGFAVAQSGEPTGADRARRIRTLTESVHKIFSTGGNA